MVISLQFFDKIIGRFIYSKMSQNSSILGFIKMFWIWIIEYFLKSMIQIWSDQYVLCLYPSSVWLLVLIYLFCLTRSGIQQTSLHVAKGSSSQGSLYSKCITYNLETNYLNCQGQHSSPTSLFSIIVKLRCIMEFLFYFINLTTELLVWRKLPDERLVKKIQLYCFRKFSILSDCFTMYHVQDISP